MSAPSPHGVQCQDRRYRFKSYPHCFVGSEAVDWLCRCGYAKSREEAFVLGVVRSHIVPLVAT